jgi:hypothetical protein
MEKKPFNIFCSGYLTSASAHPTPWLTAPIFVVACQQPKCRSAEEFHREEEECGGWEEQREESSE